MLVTSDRATLFGSVDTTTRGFHSLVSDTPYGCPFTRESLSSASKMIIYPHFGQDIGTKRVSNWYSPTKRELKVPTFTCLHFHFSLQLTTTNRINNHNQSKFLLSCAHALHFTFSPVCPLECAALLVGSFQFWSSRQ
jgi:hypothetical protein